MQFDHLAYLVRSTVKTVEAFRPFFPDVRILRQAHEQQAAYISYLATHDGAMTIELVEPFSRNERLLQWLDREKKDCIPYHICVAVDDIDAEHQRLRQLGWLTLTRPFETLTPGVKASHLFRPEGGIVEITGRSG